MWKNNGVALLVAAFLGSVFSLWAWKQKGGVTPPVIHKVNLVIPATSDEKGREAIIEKLTAMERQRFIYLDLSINFGNRSNSEQPFTLVFKGKPQAPQGCSIGPLPMGADVRYDLHGLADYNHLLISAFTGARSAFAYLDVSCEYTRSGQENQFHIRGFFHVLANRIPTAVSLQLRPFTPALDVARKILLR